MFQYKDYQIYLACGSTDMRKSINGLSQIVEYTLMMNPFDKIMFVFCNRQRNRIKILVWEENGFWIHFKRYEKGTILWTEKIEESQTMELSEKELENLMKVPSIKQKIMRKELLK